MVIKLQWSNLGRDVLVEVMLFTVLQLKQTQLARPSQGLVHLSFEYLKE